MIAGFLTVSRQARYFVLGPPPSPTREIWIVLHGYAQLAERFLRWFAPIDDGARSIVAPEALSRFYLETTLAGSHGPAVGATWLTREARDADLQDHLAYLDRLVEHLGGGAEPAVPVTVLGFSQGAVMAARWVMRRPVRVQRLIVWGTPLPSDVDAKALGRRLGGVPVDLVSGSRDPYAPLEAMEEAAAGLTAGGARVALHRYEGGHRVEAGLLTRLAGSAGQDHRRVE